MPVFDFSDTPNEKKDPECTYEVFYSNESEATPEKPILILDNSALSVLKSIKIILSSNIETKSIIPCIFSFSVCT